MKQVILMFFAVVGGAVLLSGPAHSQTELSPGKKDIPEAQKIYSPYVERTVNDRNFAEGLYWATRICTRAIPLTRG